MKKIQITLYHFQNSKCEKRVFGNVHWEEVSKTNFFKTGMKTADSILVIIPTKEDISISENDIVVKGICEYIGNDRDKLYDQYNGHTISMFNKNISGTNLSNIELSCK